MDLRDLIGMSSEDIKRMEMDKHRKKVIEGKTTEEYLKEIEILREQYE